MAKKVKQFRYFGEGDNRNYPTNPALTANALNEGSLFPSPILKIGIQGLPGTIFYLNDSRMRVNPIMLGYTGLYELDLEGLPKIYTLNFDTSSIDMVNSNPDAYLIIDIIYEEE